MRAERLLRLILILGDGRRRTAAALAGALEVSERTILRDISALAEAGIPVESARGPEGGLSLPRAWARYAAGLTADEVAALAAWSDPAVEVALGKVLAALPAMQRAQAEAARQRFLVDPSPWWSDDRAVADLDVLRDAVTAEQEVRLTYRGEARTVRPLGLVVKASRWYLIAETDLGRRTFRGDRIEAAVLTGTRFARDPSFDLRAAWEEEKMSFVLSRPSYPVVLSLTEAGRRMLLAQRPVSERGSIVSEPATVDFQREEIALAQLVALGSEARVLEPRGLIARMAEIAASWSRAERERPAEPNDSAGL